MIVKRMKIFRRRRYTWPRSTPGRDERDMHTENVIRESWWLFGIIPLYVRENTSTHF